MQANVLQRHKGFVYSSISAACLVIAGCGGGDSAPSVPVLQGLAATGAALANASVTAKCIAGAPVVGTTAADGSFTLTLGGGQTAPCMLQVVGGSPSVTMHSFAAQAGRVNITPLTDLAVTRALGSDPATAFGAFDSAKGSSINAAMESAKAYVNTQVSSITGSTSSVDILNGVFVVGDANDKLLDALFTRQQSNERQAAYLTRGSWK
jgi:hypothetical protein